MPKKATSTENTAPKRRRRRRVNRDGLPFAAYIRVSSARSVPGTSLENQEQAIRAWAEAQGVEVDRLLVVTFTHAAAAEMRGRLREALRERAQNLRKQAKDLMTAPAIDRGEIGRFGAIDASDGDNVVFGGAGSDRIVTGSGIDVDDFAVGKRQRALQHVLELAHVARKCVALQVPQRDRRQPRRLPQSGASRQPAQQRIRQQRDVVGTLAQRRQLQLDHQPVCLGPRPYLGGCP